MKVSIRSVLKKTASSPIFWSPSDERIKSSQMYKFMKNIDDKNNINLDSSSDLQSWQNKNKVEFCLSIWDFYKMIGPKGIKPYIDPLNKMPGSKFFLNGKVNFAENMLSGGISGPAIIFKSKYKIRKEVSWKKLKKQVAALANFLKKHRVFKGDRYCYERKKIKDIILGINSKYNLKIFYIPQII